MLHIQTRSCRGTSTLTVQSRKVQVDVRSQIRFSTRFHSTADNLETILENIATDARVRKTDAQQAGSTRDTPNAFSSMLLAVITFRRAI